MQRATCSGVSPMFTPSASSTSALPDLLDTERLPCLATLAPAAAATKAAAVEMLKVCALSPPVPQVSSRCAWSGTSTLRGELAHHLRGRGDLADRLLLHPQADDDRGDQRRRQLPAHHLAHERDHLLVEDLAVLDDADQRVLWFHDLPRCRRCPSMARLAQEIAQQLVPLLGQDRLGVELHPLDRQRVVWRTPMMSPSSVQAVTSSVAGRTAALDHQRMVARRRQRLLQPA